MERNSCETVKIYRVRINAAPAVLIEKYSGLRSVVTRTMNFLDMTVTNGEAIFRRVPCKLMEVLSQQPVPPDQLACSLCKASLG
jgi:hypothetical protein